MLSFSLGEVGSDKRDHCRVTDGAVDMETERVALSPSEGSPNFFRSALVPERGTTRWPRLFLKPDVVAVVVVLTDY